MNAAPRQPNIMAGALILPVVTLGKTEASMHPQIVEAMHLEAAVDHRQLRLAAHPARPAQMEDRIGARADIGDHLVIALRRQCLV